MPSETFEIEEDFYITRGDDFALTVDFAGEDVSDNQYAAQVRVDPDADAFLDFSVDTNLAEEGYVVISLTDTQTRSMVEGRYVFDLQETNALGLINTIFTASIRMRGDVTK